MNILIAEDEPNIAMLYRNALEARKHRVVVAKDGEACLNAYHNALEQATESKTEDSYPFDVVVLDHRMPKKDGLEVAKEILKLNPDQRIIFASAYVRDTLASAARELGKVVEIMQKPFKMTAFVDTIEDKKISDELRKFNVKVHSLKERDPTNKEVIMLLEELSKIQKPYVWYSIGDIMAA